MRWKNCALRQRRADQREIGFLRSNLEIARADSRQLKGQLEVARSDKGRLSNASAQAEATRVGRPLSVVAISSKASVKAEATEPRAEG